MTGDGGLSDAGPGGDYAVSPTALSFEACPSRTSGGAAIADVFPDVQVVTISNPASTSRSLEVRLLGNDAGLFSLPTPAPTTTGAMSSTPVQVAFSPRVAGQSLATLSIGAPGGVATTVTLLGSTLALPPTPVLETAPQLTNLSGFATCTDASPLSDCTLEFPDTLFGQSKTLQLKLRNRGCPSLKVTSITLQGSSNPGASDGFTLASPAVLPTAGNPLVLQVADGTDERTLTVRFTATDDGSGLGVQDRFAVISFTSNDPVVGDGAVNPARLALVARAIR